MFFLLEPLKKGRNSLLEGGQLRSPDSVSCINFIEMINSLYISNGKLQVSLLREVSRFLKKFMGNISFRWQITPHHGS